MKKNFLFTSESVSEGHPDKVCDRISDMVVDTFLASEPEARVACETLTTTNKVVLAGEVRGPELKEDELISKVRECIKDIGYDQEGFTWKEATKIESHLHSQSADIAIGVDASANNGISAYISPKGQVIDKILPTDKGFIEFRSFKKSNKTIFSSHGNKIFFYFLSIYISLIFFFKTREN